MDHITLVSLTSYMTLIVKIAANLLLENCSTSRTTRRRTHLIWPLVMRYGIALNYSATHLITPTCFTATTFFLQTQISPYKTWLQKRRGALREGQRRSLQTSQISFICKEFRCYRLRWR